jgi:hypothetical protein
LSSKSKIHTKYHGDVSFGMLALKFLKLTQEIELNKIDCRN